jgi:hypothetical protein
MNNWIGAYNEQQAGYQSGARGAKRELVESGPRKGMVRQQDTIDTAIDLHNEIIIAIDNIPDQRKKDFCAAEYNRVLEEYINQYIAGR